MLAAAEYVFLHVSLQDAQLLAQSSTRSGSSYSREFGNRYRVLGTLEAAQVLFKIAAGLEVPVPAAG